MNTSVESVQSELVVCSYHNHSQQLQIARITNIPNWSNARVVFPRQHLLFNAPEAARLEIHSSEQATAIQCDQLQVKSA